MGNSARKGPRPGPGPHEDHFPDKRKKAGATAPQPVPSTEIQLSLEDVVYPANDVTQPDHEALRVLREALVVDPEGFLLDNLLMAVQYFQNYEREVAELLRGLDNGSRGTPLEGAPCRRVVQPDALLRAAARHVRWRPRPSEPDRLVAPERRVVVDDTLRLHSVGGAACTPQPCPAATHYHLVTETGPKPGHIKLRQVGRSCSGDFREDHEDLKEDLSEHLVEDNVHLRPPGTPGKTASPTASLRSTSSLPILDGRRSPRRAPRSVDSVITSDGSMTPSSLSLSDTSASSKMSRKVMALDEFRPNNGPGADGDVNAVPDECFQPVMMQRQAVGSRHEDEEEDELGPEAYELRVQSYLQATPFFARFADVFHDTLATAMAFSRESVVLATVRGAGGPAAIQCEEQVDDEAAPFSQAVRVVQCEVFPALALPAWPRAAAEWVYRDRGAWPPRPVIRRVHGLGGVAVAAGSGDLSSLQWTMSFPAAEQLLELSLPARDAHTYLTLLALRHLVPGLTAHHLRAGFLRVCERAQQAAAPQTWSPGGALRQALATMYRALQRRHLQDYFVSDRNILAETPISQIRQAQERVFRLREFTLPSVLKTCRRLAYVREDDFYPRLDLDKLTAILNGSAAAQGSPRSRAEHRDDEHRDDEHRDDEHADDEHADDTEWLQRFRRNFQEEKTHAAARVRPTKPPPITPESIKLGPVTKERHERTASVLKLFSEHFIKMAEASNKFDALPQARHYLRHALHLLILLEQDYNSPSEAKPLFARLIQTDA